MNDEILVVAAFAAAVSLSLRLVRRLRAPLAHRWRQPRARAISADFGGETRGQIHRIADRTELHAPTVPRENGKKMVIMSARHLVAILAALTLTLGVGATASAKSSQVLREGDVAACIRKAAKGRAWLERTLWGLRDQEGGWVGAAVANSNGTHDLGPLQVNSWWVPKIAALVRRPEPHVRHWLQYDACFNAEAARWIFLSGLAVTGDYWKAIGVYHSPTAWRQARYAKSVAAHLRDRFGAATW